MTKAEAQALAKHDRAYVARRSRNGGWIVWDCKSDHEVEFNAFEAFREAEQAEWEWNEKQRAKYAHARIESDI